MSKTVILSAARTPVGKFGGSLKDVKATELGGIVKRRLKEQMFLLVMLRSYIRNGYSRWAGANSIAPSGEGCWNPLGSADGNSE